jgi:tetratricopeptide (TPR) repeat protein
MRRKYALLALLLFSSIYVQAQGQAAAVDSMKRALSKVVDIPNKIYWLDLLSRTLMNVDMQEAEKYGNQLIEIAEESRDRKLMITAYLSNGDRCTYFAGTKDYINRAIEYYNKGLDIAKQNRLDEQSGKALLKLAWINLAIPDKDKALSYANQAFSIISTVTNDSLKAESYNIFGDVYLVRNEKILSLRNYLIALRLAEEIKNPSLLRTCNVNLSGFYSNIGDYDRAIDYYMKANKYLDDIKERNTPYARVVDMSSIGNLYAQKKNHDLAISYFERSIAMADSLKFSNLKIPGYIYLLNQYLRTNKPKEALTYFNSASGKELKEFLNKFGFSGVVDQAYGVIYGELNQFDSSMFYFQKAYPFFEKSPNPASNMSFYAQLADVYKKMGKYDTAIALYTRVKEIADRIGQLEAGQKAAKHLDTLYVKSGNFQLASKFNSIYYQYKDSLEKINKEKELAQVEATDEQMRLARMEKEKQEAKRKRFNIQYLAITIGITALFVALVMLGMFRVSRTTIKMLGFFAFLMFFEFIFLIFKKNIASITEGEPWKDLLFMIGLAALLLPLHHWLEHKVIHYLTSHNRLTEAGSNLRNRLFNRKKAGGQ